MEPLRRIVRAGLSLVFLAGWVVGLPAALARWGRWPIDETPTLDQIRDLPSTVATDSALFGVLTVAAWVVWLAFTVSVIVEVAAGLGSRRVTVPLCGPLQRTARTLVASLVMSISATGTASAAGPGLLRATPVVAFVDQDHQVASESHTSPVSHLPDDHTYNIVEVGHHDTYWAIAERVLGDGMRWRDLRNLNAGRAMPDGHVLGSDEGGLLPGWTLLIPADPTHHAASPAHSGAAETQQQDNATAVTVAAGDSMWSIAEAHLATQLGPAPTDAEVAEYCAAFVEANRDRLADPANPDLIYAGQSFLLPPAQNTTAPPARPQTGEPHTTGVPAPSTPPPSPAPTTPPSTTTTAPPSQAPTTQPPTAAPANSSAPAPTPPADTGNTDGDEADDEGSDESWLVGLAAGGMALAGVVVVLQRRRRAQLRHRAPGERVRLPTSRLQAAEAQLHAAAALLDSQLVDLALRVVAANAGGAGPPPLRWIETRGDTIRLVLIEPAEAPSGFRAEAPDRWRLAVTPQELAELDATPTPPFPTLCPLGATIDGAELLVDLESVGVMTIGGDDRQIQDLLRAIAVATATAPWSQQPRVLLVGMTDNSASMPNIQVASTFGEALDAVEDHVARVAESLRSVRCATVVQARTTGITPDAWEPLIAISAKPPTDLDAHRLVALTRTAGHAAAVVCPHTHRLPVGPRCVIDIAGDLRVHGVDGLLRAHRLADNDLRVMVDLVDDAQDHTPAPEPAPGPETGTPVAEPAPGIETRTPAASPRPPRPEVGLDHLLADVDVVIRVLGDVEASRRPPGAPPAAWPDDWQGVPFDRHRALEVLCYLALRDGRVAMEDVQAAMFPAGTNAPRTFHNAVTGARRTVGDDLFPHPQEGRYQLSDRIATDYGLFSELAAQADEAGDPATSMRLRTEALTLIRGEPFLGPGRGFAWVGPHRGMIVAQVTDTAERLADTAIETDDWRKAEWAARQGLRAFPVDERMYRILMRAAHAAGNIAGVQHTYRELLDALADPDTGVEPEDTVHPETIKLLQHLTGRATA